MHDILNALRNITRDTHWIRFETKSDIDELVMCRIRIFDPFSKDQNEYCIPYNIRTLNIYYEGSPATNNGKIERSTKISILELKRFKAFRMKEEKNFAPLLILRISTATMHH